MTEAEWLASEDAGPMLAWLGDGTETIRTRWHGATEVRRWRVSKRKVWLFLAAMGWPKAVAMGRVWKAVRLMSDLESWADAGAQGKFGHEDWDAPPHSHLLAALGNSRLDAESAFYLHQLCDMAQLPLEQAISQLRLPAGGGPQLREVIGNPFRPPRLQPLWLAFAEGEVVRLAEDMHARRDFAAMPILADALEEAGCADDALLSHLRGPGPHVRGCWVLDLLRGRS